MRLSIEKGRLRNIFELVVVAAFVTTMFQGAFQWEDSLDVNGRTVAFLKIAVGPTLGLLFGLAVSRLRSMIAAVLFVAEVGLAVLLTWIHLSDGDAIEAPFLWGLISVLFDIIGAAIIIFWIFSPSKASRQVVGG